MKRSSSQQTSPTLLSLHTKALVQKTMVSRDGQHGSTQYSVHPVSISSSQSEHYPPTRHPVDQLEPSAMPPNLIAIVAPAMALSVQDTQRRDSSSKTTLGLFGTGPKGSTRRSVETEMVNPPPTQPLLLDQRQSRLTARCLRGATTTLHMHLLSFCFRTSVRRRYRSLRKQWHLSCHSGAIPTSSFGGTFSILCA